MTVEEGMRILVESLALFAPDGTTIQEVETKWGNAVSFEIGIHLGLDTRLVRMLTLSLEIFEDNQEGYLAYHGRIMGERLTYRKVSIDCGYQDENDLYNNYLAINLPEWPCKPKVEICSRAQVLLLKEEAKNAIRVS